MTRSTPSQLMHALWTKAVGTNGYDKEQWKYFESEIVRLERIADDHAAAMDDLAETQRQAMKDGE